MIRVSRLEVKSPSGGRLLEASDLDVPERSVLGVYGPNGSGKSSLLRAIAGESADVIRHGEVMIDGIPIELLREPSDRIKRVMYLGSDFRSPFQLTVRDLLELGIESASGRMWPGINSSEIDRISNVVESLELLSFMPRTFQTLSDGEKQLVMFARALVQAPKVLILDETFSKLDLDRLISVTKIIRAWTACGMTFLISSHDLNFLSEISDQMVFLKKGRIIAGGPVDSVLNESNLRELFTRVAPHVVTSPETGKRKILY
jgi:iron complex transport system ATP-binding protein